MSKLPFLIDVIPFHASYNLRFFNLLIIMCSDPMFGKRGSRTGHQRVAFQFLTAIAENMKLRSAICTHNGSLTRFEIFGCMDENANHRHCPDTFRS